MYLYILILVYIDFVIHQKKIGIVFYNVGQGYMTLNL